MAASDRVIVNAGGRLFETTTTTLRSSGSAYFHALLGATGAALGSLTKATALMTHDRKRARYDENQDNSSFPVRQPSSAANTAPSSSPASPAAEIFVDRDPDLFADVVHFIRGAGLSGKVRNDITLLDDLKAEALFFGYDELGTACEEALKIMRVAVEDALKPEPMAICEGLLVQADQRLEVFVPDGQVPYVTSATLAG